MKKVIAILAVMMLVAGAVFAATVKVQSQVEGKVPAYVLRAGVDGTNWLAVSGTEADTITYDKVGSIGEDDVIVYFQILQQGSEGEERVNNLTKNFAKTGKTYSFAIEVGELVQIENAEGAAVAATDAYMVDGDVLADSGEAAAVNAENKKTDGTPLIKIIKNNDASYKAEYFGKVYDGQAIAQFQAKWGKDAFAKEGIYEATITLTIASN